MKSSHISFCFVLQAQEKPERCMEHTSGNEGET